MRLIDAEKLRAEYLGMPNCYNGFSDTYDKAMIVDMVDEQPTIDAVPVKHGYWLPYEFCTDGTWDKCSVCGVAHRTRSKYTGYIDGVERVIQDRMNYCPICGAKMDGGKDDESHPFADDVMMGEGKDDAEQV